MERPHMYGIELSRLRNLSNEPCPPRKIHFRLESDTLPARDSYLDLYVPEFHQYASSSLRQVRHLDVTSTWRRLSTIQAEELKFWEDMFAAVLEYTVSNHLIDLVDGMDDCNVDRYQGDLDFRICSFVNKLGGKTFPVNVCDIITCMLELYRRHGHQHQWLASGGNLRGALCEFLRTRDCFLDTPLRPTLKVFFSAKLSSQNEPTIVGTLKRFGPLMGFNRLDAFASEKTWCEIRPSYVEPTLDPSYPSFLGRPEYRLASDWVKFSWENDVEGFRGYIRPIPILNQGEDVRTPLNVDLAAVSKRSFPGEVFLERNLRVRIKLSVFRITTMSSTGDSMSQLNVPLTASAGDSMPQLPHCRQRRSLFKPPPGLQDLSEVMKANKRSAASSPTKLVNSPQKKEKKAKAEKAKACPTMHDYIVELLEKTMPSPTPVPLEVNTALEETSWWQCHSPPMQWGRNVPAWGTLPGCSTERRESHGNAESVPHRRKPPSDLTHTQESPLGSEEKHAIIRDSLRHSAMEKRRSARETMTSKQSNHTETPSCPLGMNKNQLPTSWPQTRFFEKALDDSGVDTEHDPVHSSALTQPVEAQPRPPRRNSLLFLDHAAKVASDETSDDKYVVIQPTYSLSSCDLYDYDPPLEMKRTSGRLVLQQLRSTITHYPCATISPRPAVATPVRPASISPWPAAVNLICPASAPHPSHSRIDSAVGASCGTRPASTIWASTGDVMTSRNSSGVVDDNNTAWVSWRNDGNEGAPPVPFYDVKERVPPPSRWYVPPSTDLERHVEQLRVGIKEWYDAMLLKQDTPCRKSREERSQEEAMQAAFLGDESGEDGDVEEEDEEEEGVWASGLRHR